LTRVKIELGIANSNVDDDLIRRLIDQSSAAIVRYCERPFAEEVYKETVAGFGSIYLMLSRTPVTAVSSVIRNGDTITDFTIENPEAGLLLREAGWSWTAATGWNLTGYTIANSELPKFTVAYTAGYELSDDATPTLPFDVERAAIEMVKDMWLVRGQTATTGPIKSKRVGDLAITYGTVTAAAEGFTRLPPRSLALLERWRRVV